MVKKSTFFSQPRLVRLGDWVLDWPEARPALCWFPAKAGGAILLGQYVGEFHKSEQAQLSLYSRLGCLLFLLTYTSSTILPI